MKGMYCLFQGRCQPSPLWTGHVFGGSSTWVWLVVLPRSHVLTQPSWCLVQSVGHREIAYNSVFLWACQILSYRASEPQVQQDAMWPLITERLERLGSSLSNFLSSQHYDYFASTSQYGEEEIQLFWCVGAESPPSPPLSLPCSTCFG